MPHTARAAERLRRRRSTRRLRADRVRGGRDRLPDPHTADRARPRFRSARRSPEHHRLRARPAPGARARRRPRRAHLGGPGVARGYVNRPEETAARFIADPFAAAPGARPIAPATSRAGGRTRPGIPGPPDSQVKIRELRSSSVTEAVSSDEPCVREAAVVVHEDSAACRLVAYVVGRDGHTSSEALATTRAGCCRLHGAGRLRDRSHAAADPRRQARPAALAALPGRRSARASGARSVPMDSLEGQPIDLGRTCWASASRAADDDFFELGGTRSRRPG